jgi:cytochrome P450
VKSLDEIDFLRDDLPGRELHDALAGFRRRGPVTPATFLGTRAWIIAGHRALAEAFRDGQRFPPHLMYQVGIERVIGRTFISMEGAEHQVFRKLATPALRSRAVASYERDGLAALAHELIDRLERRSQVDLIEEFAARFPYLVITRLLGLPREREDDFHGWALALLRFRDDPARAAKAAWELTTFLAPVVEERRREPRNDVISELALAEVDGRTLTDDEIYSHIRLLFPTGGETTHGTLGNLLWAVLTQEDSWERVCSEPRLAEGAVDEILRWESSIAVLPRLTGGEPVEFHGVQIPAGAWVLFAIAGANRDPDVFPDPDRYDIERRCDEALTFGPGLKSCPGMHLARKNLIVALQVLAERLPRLRLVDEEGAVPRRTVLRSPDQLHATWR